MATIRVDDLVVGEVTDRELLGPSGEVLVKQGVTITENVVGALIRRGISEVHSKGESDEIKEILSTKITGMEDLDFDLSDEPPGGDDEESAPAEAPAKALSQMEELKKVKHGKEGFFQTLRTQSVLDFENRINNMDALPDRPVGEPITAKATQIERKDRSEEYKQSVSDDYENALTLTETLLNDLREGTSADGRRVQRLVEKFVDTYITDRNILLNLSSIKSDASEDYLFNHCLNVCLLAINIAAAAGYSRRQVVEIGMGAILHDMGMMLIPQGIRMKKGSLSNDEFFEVRKHPVLGLHLLQKIANLPESVAYVAYQTHEREDGKGYPKGRSGRFLHYYARIVMIADIFEAMSSPRSYRPAHLPYKAMEFLLAFVRKGQLRSDLVKSFIGYASLFPVGSLVRISSNEVGKVIEANGINYTRPTISVIADKDLRTYDAAKIREIDLGREKDIKVVQALSNDVVKDQVMLGF